MPARLPESLRLDELKTPIGTALLLTDGEGVLRALDWQEFADRVRREVPLHYRGAEMRPGRAPDRIRKALSAYFAGDLAAVDAIPVAAEGTPFQQKVWAALRRIPVGETLSYSALAKKIGHPAAIRAVGLANGANPISVVVPCHRVIGADGTLTGYGGGLPRKRWLLAHEGAAFVDEPMRRRA
ncbi:MAG TPA: methylated-DNA--[protein]-cysteine S-methyltransferase [Stellaceae bacterium]|nr:methylated-DNA--[protein]-cysteine S-methyltransferase [Stellaceae bacterium]